MRQNTGRQAAWEKASLQKSKNLLRISEAKLKIQHAALVKCYLIISIACDIDLPIIDTGTF
jgi:hypothetical protein